MRGRGRASSNSHNPRALLCSSWEEAVMIEINIGVHRVDAILDTGARLDNLGKYPPSPPPQSVVANVHIRYQLQSSCFLNQSWQVLDNEELGDELVIIQLNPYLYIFLLLTNFLMIYLRSISDRSIIFK